MSTSVIDVVVYSTGTWWAKPWELAFIEGLRSHGIEPEYRHQSRGRRSDLAVIWSHRNHRLFALQDERDYLVMERGYIGDRHEWTALCFNGLNGYADRMPAGDSGERFDTMATLTPWREDGQYALVCGQVPGDASIAGVNIERWVSEQCRELLDYGYDVRYRPHPQYGGRFCPRGVSLSTGSLTDDLSGAAVVVTYNSNSGTDAVLAGVPTVTTDRGSMTWDVSTHEIGELYRGERSAWAAWIAWQQWRRDEICNGDAWEYLRHRYD